MAIVQAVVAMGRSLGMRVVAEGVETEVQADLLRHLGCDDMQGYLVAQPMPAAEIAAFLQAQAAERAVEDGASRYTGVIPLRAAAGA